MTRQGDGTTREDEEFQILIGYSIVARLLDPIIM